LEFLSVTVHFRIFVIARQTRFITTNGVAEAVSLCVEAPGQGQHKGFGIVSFPILHFNWNYHYIFFIEIQLITINFLSLSPNVLFLPHTTRSSFSLCCSHGADHEPNLFIKSFNVIYAIELSLYNFSFIYFFKKNFSTNINVYNYTPLIMLNKMSFYKNILSF
jgi:hypothetical protein